jgi:hypothetical protein
MSGRTAEQIAEAFAAEFLPTGDPGYVNEEGQPPNNGAPMPRGPEDYGLPAIDESDESTAESGARTPRKLRFPLVPFDQIAVDTERRGYLVKGLLASTGLAVIWGPPKCGKSFWAVDVGLHISLGWEYRGRRVQQATVVYIALEGQHGLPARIEAFKRHHGVRSSRK